MRGQTERSAFFFLLRGRCGHRPLRVLSKEGVGAGLVPARCGSTQGLSVCGARQMRRPTAWACILPTAAHAAPLLHLPLAAQRLAALRNRRRAVGERIATAALPPRNDMRFMGVRGNGEHLIRPLRGHLPLKGKALGCGGECRGGNLPPAAGAHKVLPYEMYRKRV